MYRFLLFCLLLAFSICYLEWGHNSSFIFQAEYLIFSSKKKAAENFLHPAILIPLSGQILLLVAMLQKHPSRWLIISGIVLTGLLVLLILLAGALGGRIMMILSTLPFLALAALLLRKRKPA